MDSSAVMPGPGPNFLGKCRVATCARHVLHLFHVVREHGNYHAIAYPNEESFSGRTVRHSDSDCVHPRVGVDFHEARSCQPGRYFADGEGEDRCVSSHRILACTSSDALCFSASAMSLPGRPEACLTSGRVSPRERKAVSHRRTIEGSAPRKSATSCVECPSEMRCKASRRQYTNSSAEPKALVRKGLRHPRFGVHYFPDSK